MQSLPDNSIWEHLFEGSKWMEEEDNDNDEDEGCSKIIICRNKFE